MTSLGAWSPRSMLARGLLFLCGLQPPVMFAQASAEPSGSSAEQQTLYALGVLISRNLEDFQLTPQEFERVEAGLIDGFNRRAVSVDLTVDSPKVQALRQSRMAQVVERRQADGQAYLESAAALPKAKRTASGLVMVPVKAGSGVSPGKNDEVSVNYRGKLIDGTEFDASKGGPAKFSLNAVIPCWSEALPLMKVGAKARIVCPPGLAYGARGAAPRIAAQSTLDFDVELVGFVAVPTPASMPASAVPTPASSRVSAH